jgi:hypothetical protein
VPIIVEVLSSRKLATGAGTNPMAESLACWYSFPDPQRHRAGKTLIAFALQCRLISLVDPR